MIEWIAGITWRDVFFMFFGSGVVWAACGVAKWFMSDWVKAITSNPWGVFRYWVMVLSLAGALWLSEQPELSSRDILFMIIFSLAAYWSMTTQHQNNIEERRKNRVDPATDEKESQVPSIKRISSNKRENSDRQHEHASDDR